jgi:cytochrome c556
MEGLAHPNFKAVDRHLQDQPEDAEAWQFARGQSLLIAETANLLLLRPPKDARAEEAWMSRATDLRANAAQLAKATAAHDLPKSRTALAGVAASCNRCHETFRVEVRLEVSHRQK